MFAFVRYQVTSFIQSLKIIPPTAMFFAWIFILYAYKNVPILSSYGVSSIAMYLTMTWVTMSIFTLEEDSEKHILFFQLGGKGRYLLGKWLTIFSIMIPYLLLAIFFPIVTNSFNGNMTILLYIIAFYSHVVFSVFGILVGTLFSATTFSGKKTAWVSAVFIIVLSLASKSIIELFPFLKWVLWFVPPVFQVIEHMEGGSELVLQDSIAMDVGLVILYIIIGAAVLVPLFRKKES